MTIRPLRTCLLTSSLALAACASPGDFPSIAMRDSERVGMTTPVVQTPLYTPAPTPAITLEEVGTLTARVEAAHQDFLARIETARHPVAAAQGAPIGSDAYSLAHLALADLEVIRSDSMIALADLDQLYVDTIMAGEEYAQIDAARTQLSQIVNQQEQLIGALAATIGN